MKYHISEERNADDHIRFLNLFGAPRQVNPEWLDKLLFDELYNELWTSLEDCLLKQINWKIR